MLKVVFFPHFIFYIFDIYLYFKKIKRNKLKSVSVICGFRVKKYDAFVHVLGSSMPWMRRKGCE